MSKRRKITGGIIAVVGFVLSPVSWWNDIVVNIPLSYLIATPIGWINKSFFLPAFVAAYWAGNLLGLVLMHHGVLMIKESERNLKKSIVQSLPFTLLYTLVMVGLVQLGWVKLPWEYFGK